MRKYIHNLTALVMAVFVLLEFTLPAFTSIAQEEDTVKLYTIENLDKYKLDDKSEFSLHLATQVDNKNLESDSNIKFALKTSRDSQNIKLIVRNDLYLYDENPSTLKKTEKELQRLTDEFASQGLNLDVSLTEENGRYAIHNNSIQDYGKGYTAYNIDIIKDFDFDKLEQNKIAKENGSERLYVFDFKIKNASDESMISLNKEENEPVSIYHEGDLLAALIDEGNYTLYQTSQLYNDVDLSIKTKEKKSETKIDDLKLQENKDDVINSNPKPAKKQSKTEIITNSNKEDKISEPDKKEVNTTENVSNIKENKSEKSISEVFEHKSQSLLEKSVALNLFAPSLLNERDDKKIGDVEYDILKPESISSAFSERQYEENNFHIGLQTNPEQINRNWKPNRLKYNVYRVLENYDLVWSINWGAKEPTNPPFWNDPSYKISKRQIKEARDLRPIIPSHNFGTLDSAYPVEQIYEKLKQGFYYANEVVPYNYDNITVYNGMLAAYIGELTSNKTIFEREYKNRVGVDKNSNDLINQKFRELKSKISDEIQKGNWTKEISNSVEIISYVNNKSSANGNVGNNNSLYQNMITGKVHKPVEIKIIDENGNFLQGAKLKITGENGYEYIWTTSNATEKLYLPIGNYRILEIESPDGRNQIETFEFTVGNVKNEADSIEKSNIPLKKTNDDIGILPYNLPIPQKDIKKVLYENNNNNLRNSSYFVFANYISEERSIMRASDNEKVEISNDRLQISIKNPKNTKPNVKYGNVTFKKTDSKGMPLSNVEFTLVGGGNEITKKTFVDGLVTFNNLAQGTYYVTETKTPQGYEPLNYIYQVTVNEYGVINIYEILKPKSNPVSRAFNAMITPLRSVLSNGNGITVTNYELIEGDKYNNTENQISGQPTTNVVMANINEPIIMKLSMNVDDSVKSGDTFTLGIDKKIRPRGITPTGANFPNNFNPEPITDSNGEVIAVAKYNKTTNEVTYTFTDYVDKNNQVKINISYNGMGPNRELIQRSGMYEFSNSVNGEKLDNKSLFINYTGIYGEHEKYPEDYNAKNFIPDWNRDINRATFVAYLNPNTEKNSRGPQENTKVHIKEFGDSHNIDFANMNPNTDISIYRVPYQLKDEVMVDSMKPILQKSGVIKVNKPITRNQDGTFTIDFSSTDFTPEKNNPNYKGDGYILIVDTPLKSNIGGAHIGFRWSHRENYWYEYWSKVVTFDNSSGGDGIKIDKIVKNHKDITGKFEINKIDQNGLHLQGATFTLTKDDHTFEEQKISDVDGHISFNGLKEGEYTLIETKAPENYEKSKKTWSVIVDHNGATTIREKTTRTHMLRMASGKSSAGALEYEKEGIYGDLTVTTKAKSLDNDNYAVSIDMISSATEKVDTKEDITFFVPRFDAMGQNNLNNYKNAIVRTLEQLKKDAPNQDGNIRINLIGYAGENDITQFGINHNVSEFMKIDDAINYINNNKSRIFTVDNQKSDKGLIRAVHYMVNNILLPNARGARSDAKKTFVMGSSDFYWNKGDSDGGYKDYNFNSINYGDGKVIYNGISSLSKFGTPRIRNILLGGSKESWENFITNKYQNPTDRRASDTILLDVENGTNKMRNISVDELTSAMKFYGKNIENAKFEIEFNDKFRLLENTINSSKDDTHNQYGWHIYDGNKITTVSDELSLKSGKSAHIDFVVHLSDRQNIPKGQPIPLLQNITIQDNNIPSPAVEIDKIHEYKVKIDWLDIEPIKDSIELAFSNGVRKNITKDNQGIYQASFPETEIPLDEKIVNVDLPSNYSYNVMGEDANYTIRIYKNNDAPPVLTVENTKKDDKGKFIITKTNEKREPLSDAEFTLKKGDQIITTKKSNDSGRIEFNNLEKGTYTLVETKAPDEYIKTDKTWTVIVDPNGITTVTENPKIEASNLMMNYRIARFNVLNENNRLFNLNVNDADYKITDTINDALIENSRISTKVDYDKRNDEFKYSLDITAGKDEIVQRPDTDVVILIQEPMLTPNVKNALKDKISKYGDNVKVAVHIYGDKTGYNGNLRLGSKADAIDKIIKSKISTSYPNTDTTVQNALKTVNNVFKNGTDTNQKELISIVGNSVDTNNSGINNQVKDLKTNKVNISSIFVGGNYSAGTYMQRWTTVLGVPTVNAINSNSAVLNTTLKVYGTAVQPDVDNATLDIGFNGNFNLVTDSINSSKNNPKSGQWHNGYSNEKIVLNTGELSLSDNQTAHIEFKLKAKNNISKDTPIKLINDIVFTSKNGPNRVNIESPSVILYEKKPITINDIHNGDYPPNTEIRADLVRSVDGGNDEKVGTINLGLGNTVTTEKLRTKDDNHFSYGYKLKNITTTNNVKIINAPNNEIPIVDNSATIRTNFNNNIMTLLIQSTHDGQRTGKISGILRRKIGENEQPFGYPVKFDINGNQKIAGLEKRDKSDRPYTYYVSDLKSDATIVLEGQEYREDESSLEIISRDPRGFDAYVNWNGLKEVGEIKLTLSNGNEVVLNQQNSYSYSLQGLENESIRVIKVEGSDCKNYDYTFTNTNPAVITVSKKNPENIVPNIEIVNKKALGEFTVKKVDKKGELLNDALFKLTTSEGVVAEEKSSGEDGDGLLKFKDLKPGDYILTEEQSPQGYDKTKYKWKIKVDKEGKVNVKISSENSTTIEFEETIINTQQPKLFEIGSGDYAGNPSMTLLPKIEKIENSKYNISFVYSKFTQINNPAKLKIDFDLDNFVVKRNGQIIQKVEEPFNSMIIDGNRTGSIDFTIESKKVDFQGGKRTISPIKSFEYDGQEME